MDFDMAAQLPPAQELELVNDSRDEFEYLLKVDKFTNVHMLILFFKGNFTGEDVSKLYYVGLKGENQQVCGVFRGLRVFGLRVLFITVFASPAYPVQTSCCGDRLRVQATARRPQGRQRNVLGSHAQLRRWPVCARTKNTQRIPARATP